MAFKNMKNLPRNTRFARSSKPQVAGPARTIQPVFKGRKSVHKTPLYNTFPHVEPKPWEAKKMSRDDYYRDLARKRKLDEDQARVRLLNQQKKQQMIQDKYLNNDEYELVEDKNDKPKKRSDDEFLTNESLAELDTKSKPQKVYIVKKENPREKGGNIFRNRQTYDKPKLDERFFGQDVLYGTHAVEACLTSHKRRNQCLKLFVGDGKVGEPVVKKIMDMARKLRIPVENVDRNTLNLITKHAIHNGVALVTKPLELDEILELEPFTKANLGQSIFVKTMRHGVVISEPASYLFSEEERMNSLEEVEKVEEAIEEAAVKAEIVDDASEAKEKIQNVETEAKETVTDVKESISEKIAEVKEKIEEKVEEVKEKAEDAVKAAETEIEDIVKPTESKETEKTETKPEATTEAETETYPEAEDAEELDVSPTIPTFQVTSSVESHRPRKFPLVVYLDQLNDTHNLGSILRSCQFLGADAVVVTAKNCAPLSPAVAKTSSGALEYMPVYENSKTPAQFFQKCKNNGWNIVCAAVPSASGSAKAKAEKPLSLRQCGSWLDTKPTVLVLGGEHGGVRQTILNQADHHVIVPASNSWIKNNTVDSLNVGVAAGILINRFVVV